MATLTITYRGRVGKKGTAPIEFSIQHAGKTAYIKTGFACAPEAWVGKLGRFVRCKGDAKINEELHRMLLEAQNKLQAIYVKGELGTMPIGELKDKISPWYSTSREAECERKRISLLGRLELYKETGGLKASTQVIWDRTITTIKRYLDATGNKDLRLSDVTSNWLCEFDGWLSENNNNANTIAIHMRNIRTVVNIAIEEELMAKNPFRSGDKKTGYKIQEEPTEKQPMTTEQLKVLFTAKLEDWQVEWVDLFKACFYLMGINMCDLAKLDHVDKDGYIRYKRSKTDKKGGRAKSIAVKVEPELQALIDKYKTETHLFGVFDRYKDYKCANKHMIHAVRCIGAPMVDNGSKVRYGRNCGPAKKNLDKSPLADVCQYSTRRTWSTIALNDCDIDPLTIALCLAHTIKGLEVTMRYAKTRQSTIDRANRAVIDYLNSLSSGELPVKPAEEGSEQMTKEQMNEMLEMMRKLMLGKAM